MPYIKYRHEPSKSFWQSIWTEQDPDAKVSTLIAGDDPLKRSLRRYLPPKTKILDGGCGIGQWTIYLRKQGYDAVGLDFEPETIARLNQAHSEIDWKLGDVLKIPFEDNSFDAYLSLGVLEHLEGKFIQGIQEAKRVLKPDGLIFLSVPYYSKLRGILRSYTKRHVDLPFYQYYFEEKELSEALQNQGFNIISFFKVDAIWGLLGELRYVDLLYLMLQKRIFPKSKIKAKTERKPQFMLYRMLKAFHDPVNSSDTLLRFCAHRVVIVARSSKETKKSFIS